MSKPMDEAEYRELALDALEVMYRLQAQLSETPLRNHHITLSDWALMRILARGEQVQVGGLGYLVGMQRTDAKTACYVLEQKGLVRVEHRDDGAGMALEARLTPEGQTLLNDVDAALMALFDGELRESPNNVRGMRWGCQLLLKSIKQAFKLEPVVR